MRLQLTATLVTIKKRMRQLVHIVNELEASAEQTKQSLEMLWRMITFLAPYVSSLDDPSGEMRVVVLDVKVHTVYLCGSARAAPRSC